MGPVPRQLFEPAAIRPYQLAQLRGAVALHVLPQGLADLALGAVVALLWGGPLLGWYRGLLGL